MFSGHTWESTFWEAVGQRQAVSSVCALFCKLGSVGFFTSVTFWSWLIFGGMIPPFFIFFTFVSRQLKGNTRGAGLCVPPPFVSPYFFVQLLKGGRANMFYFLSYFFYMPSFPPFLGNGRFALFSTWEWVLGNIRDMISRPGFGWFGLH